MQCPISSPQSFAEPLERTFQWVIHSSGSRKYQPEGFLRSPADGKEEFRGDLHANQREFLVGLRRLLKGGSELLDVALHESFDEGETFLAEQNSIVQVFDVLLADAALHGERHTLSLIIFEQRRTSFRGGEGEFPAHT